MNVLQMQFLDVSVKVGLAGGSRAGGEGRQNWERGMLFRNPQDAIQCKLQNDFLGRLFNKVS